MLRHPKAHTLVLIPAIVIAYLFSVPQSASAQVFEVLHEFDIPGPMAPTSLIHGQDGNFGIAKGGSDDLNVVFVIVASQREAASLFTSYGPRDSIHGVSSRQPTATLRTTELGGANLLGGLFTMTPVGVVTALHT
jgi:hypothetical protein